MLNGECIQHSMLCRHQSMCTQTFHGKLHGSIPFQFTPDEGMVNTLQAVATRALSQALSGGLPSPAHALSISAAPAAVSYLDLAAASASLTQPAASSASAGSLPPAIAAQQTHVGSDADTHPLPSPNYRMDHVLADSLHAGMHASTDFGPMSLASAMSNDENMTPAASRDFGRATRRVTQEGGAADEATPEVMPCFCVGNFLIVVTAQHDL